MYGQLFLGFLPWIPASMLVLFFFVALNVLYRALTVPAGFDKENDGHCAACGYVLGSLSNQRCPECGVDLLKAGLITRRMFIQLRGSSAGALAAWTVLFFSFAGTSLAIWGGVVQTNQMMGNMGGGMGSYTQIASYGPETSWDDEAREIQGEIFTARIEIEIDSMSQQQVGDVLLVLELPDGSEFTLEIDEDFAWVLKDQKEKKVASGDDLNADVIDDLFSLGGFDPSDEMYRSFSGQLFILVETAVDDGATGLQMGATMKLMKLQTGNDPSMNLSDYGWNTNYGAGTAAAFSLFPSMPFSAWSPILYTFLVLALIYALGIVFILRRRGKLLKLGRYTSVTSLE